MYFVTLLLFYTQASLHDMCLLFNLICYYYYLIGSYYCTFLVNITFKIM